MTYRGVNALAESQIGLNKAELIRPEGPWRGVEHVELETLNWGDFFNTERPHTSPSTTKPRWPPRNSTTLQKNKLKPTG